ncbi:MAG: hypothetical protein DRJ61_07330 [Acidobacteria bacterium]|nr:MAG: hypothetical protein DRJ61_07330 [Acidobacteriota bacterium]
MLNSEIFQTLVFPLTFLTLMSASILSFAGRPYNKRLVNIHRLSALGAVALVAFKVYRTNRALPLSVDEWAFVVLTASSAIFAIVSGGIVTAAKMPYQSALWLHRIGSGLTVALVAIAAFASLN